MPRKPPTQAASASCHVRDPCTFRSMKNTLFYGDNLEILRNKIADESVHLCYIDPPFNSKRNYNQIYNKIGEEDLAQEQAFVDTWTWNDHARTGYEQIIVKPFGTVHATDH